MNLTLKSAGQDLAARITKPKDSKEPLPALIFIHGWRSNKSGNSKRALEVSKLGFICLSIDLRGHGDSAGTIEKFSRKDHLEDIQTAYKYLAQSRDVDPERIGIIGSSYGAYLSAVATNYLKLHWLVLRVPALYFDDHFDVSTDKLIKDDRSAFRTDGLKIENSLALRGVANFKGEILIVESEADEIIPHPVIENYIEVITNKSKLTHKIMKNASHSLETETQEKEYINLLMSFLRKRESNE
jgi:hypothetical protein